nr:MFS transporter [Corynebacterium lactis]
MKTLSTPGARAGEFEGNDRLLFGIVLAVLTFWLFAGTAGTVAPEIARDINVGGHVYLSAAAMNFAVSVTALVSGLLIVLGGSLADRVGRVRVSLFGIVLGAIGSLFLVLASGPLALPFVLIGRVLQGASAACVMPATMALVRTYWSGAARQRAVSMWSIGSWGGTGFSAIFGGAMIRFTPMGWRAIFVAYIAICVVAFLLIMRTPESRALEFERQRFDLGGMVLFMVATLAAMTVLLFGSSLGWASGTTLGLVGVAVVFAVAFVRAERRSATPFVDFALFRNRTFTGATVSNFLMNATIGMLMVSQQLIQLAGCRGQRGPSGVCAPEDMYSAWDAGLLTLGYGVAIIVFIRAGEKLLQRFGPRRPMLWGCYITAAACVLLMMTHLLVGTYVAVAVVAYALFGLGLAFYATPSTDTALANLPVAKSGAGAGIYKMASSLGGAIGAAISLAVFTGFSTLSRDGLGSYVPMYGTQVNIGLRLSAMIALGINLLFVVLAAVVIVATISRRETVAVAE